jgi:hypothetical protein
MRHGDKTGIQSTDMLLTYLARYILPNSIGWVQITTLPARDQRAMPYLGFMCIYYDFPNLHISPVFN